MIIEKGIPVPRSRSARESKYSDIIDSLGPEDPVRVETQGQANAIAAAIKAKGFRPVMRKVREKGKIFFRVWRNAMSDLD